MKKTRLNNLYRDRNQVKGDRKNGVTKTTRKETGVERNKEEEQKGQSTREVTSLG